jgi:hypothetical protein
MTLTVASSFSWPALMVTLIFSWLAFMSALIFSLQAFMPLDLLLINRCVLLAHGQVQHQLWHRINF